VTNLPRSMTPAKKCRRAAATARWYTGTMRMQRFLGLTLFPVALALAGCHEHTHEGPQADEYVVDCETADGGFAASDEDFAAVVNAEAAGTVMTTPAESLPTLMLPAAGATLSAAAPPTFSFTGTTTTAAEVKSAPTTTMACRAPGATRRKRASRFGRVMSAIKSELVLERTAEAHCAATSGDKYLLRLQTSSGDPVFTAMLSVTTYTPDAEKWAQKLSSREGQTLTLTLMRATFSGEAIAAGPFLTTPAPTFLIGP
jgi:hypothetical protein